MANNIDELHFEVILKDTDFRERVAKDIELADKLNVRLSDALNFNKKVQIEPLKRVSKEFINIEKNSKRAGKAGKDYNAVLGNSNNLLRTLGQLTGVAFSVVGLRRFLSTMIDVTGQFEVQKMALRNMLQDIDKADKIFDDLYQFSSRSTYRFSELAKYAKQLAAFNIAPDSLLETTKRLGDVASGVGVSMDRIILAYGHVKSSGFLRGIQLRSFSQNGVPVLEELAKMLEEVEGHAISLGDVFDRMMKRQITFEMVEEAFRRMTSEGGKFYQMQEVLAKTLAGQINILKGKWENLMYAIGESQEGVLKGAVASLTKIVASTEAFGKAVGNAAKFIGIYQTALITLTAVTKGWAAAQEVGILRVLKKIGLLNPYVALAAGIAAVTVALINMNKELTDSQKIEKALTDTTNAYDKSLANELRELDILIGRLKAAHEGTQEYAAAKAALEKRFDPYIQQLRNEGVAVRDLTALYEGLAKKITDANKQKFLEKAQTSIVEAYSDSMNAVEDDTARIIDSIAHQFRRKLSGDEEGAIRHYVATGEKNAVFAAMGLEGRYGTRALPGAPGSPQQIIKDEESFYERLKKLFLRSTLAADTYADSMTEAAKKFDAAMSTITGGNTLGQQFTIKEIVAQIKDLDKQLSEVRSKPGFGTADEETIKQLQSDRDELAKMYKTLMGVDYDKNTRSEQTASDKAIRDRISSLKAEISVMEKVKDARDRLEPYFGDQTNLQLAKLFGAKDFDSLDADLQRLIANLRLLGEEGVQAADQIEARLGMDALGLLLKQQEKLKKYEDTLADWMGEDFSHEGTGVEYKAGRIAAKYNDNIVATQKKFNEAVKQATEAHKGNTAAIAAEVEKLKELRDAEMAFHAAQRDEGIAALAKQVYSEATNGLDLANWGRKSIGELNTIGEKLKNLELPAWIHRIFEHNPEGFEKFVAAFKDLINADQEKTDEATAEKKLENFRKYAQFAQQLAGALTELGEATNNSTLQGLGEMLGFITNTASNVFERLAKGDVPGAIIAGVTSLLSHIVESITAAAKLEAQIRSVREEARRSGFSDTLKNGVDSIFGTNGAQKLRNANKVLADTTKHMAEIGKSRDIHYKKGFWDHVTFGLFKHKSSISTLAQELGMSLYDAYGNLNATTLQAILDTYKGLTKSEKEWIEQSIHDSEAYAEAMEQLRDVVDDVFGQIASSASDKIVEAWKERRDAALDYADVLDDVATKYAKMMLESAMLDMVLDEDKAKSLVQMFARGNAEAAMEQIANDLATIQAMAPVWEQILESFDPYFNRTPTSGDSLKEGINKELVEGNSSLIASYINAMRADLSVLRILQTSGWQDVRLVRESVPSLVEYSAQIAANTYDNAQNTALILSKLQSVITPSTNGGSAVRTTK